ncbi:serine/threonine-protein kinase [Kitasatospora viridis]|uniref:Serine/threonine-protein kinase n=1 Tax=Kitasatospora viridis TaxID=281105 RepID=A0A561SET2_9ACTN|nr:serine/threonine-protein kinase [Kitasatospora viridis]TWF73376.1 serine/threonine-protein kinase [Kitasatospora viridis]
MMNSPTQHRQDPADGQWTLPGYTHERELGSGGSGRVVLARHEATGTRVAVKYLSAAVEDTTRFRAEAELLGALRSPHVTRFYEYVEGPRGAAIVMEVVEGLSLRALLRQAGTTSPQAALVVLKGSLLGLAAAHRAGVVHRDYKPENVLVTADGASKLVDFGVALRDGRKGSIAGTPMYMAPEQWAGKPAAPSADVYAATVTFFECLTGSRPYNGATPTELAIKHTEAPIPDELVPEPVRALVRAGLAKTPQERPADAAAMVEQLEELAGAGYGADWQERGRDGLAALVALLPLALLPSGGAAPAGTTALATTVLGAAPPDALPADPAADRLPAPRRRPGRRSKLVAGAVGVALLGGALVGTALAEGPGAAGTTTVNAPAPELTTTLAPVADTAAPVPGATASPTGSASATPSATASASASALASASTPAKVTPEPGTGTARPAPSTPAVPVATAPGTPPTAAPSGPPTAAPTSAAASPSPAAVLRVLTVAVSGYGCYGNYGTSGTVTVTTDGAAAGTLTVSWVDGGTTRTVVATQAYALAKGQRSFSFPVSHVFADNASYWGLQVGTSPAAARGQGGYQEVAAYLCNPPR